MLQEALTNFDKTVFLQKIVTDTNGDNLHERHRQK